MDLAYDNETKILEYININLWELFLVISASDACYFMLIMNSTLVFQYIEFLKKKTINETLDILKRFMIEVERLTRKKVM